MQLKSKHNKGIRYLLRAIHLFSKYAFDKKGITIANAFQSILENQTRCGLIKAVGFTTLILKNIEMYSTHNEGKSVVAERFIRTLENKIYKHITTISKNVYFNVLNDIVDEYNNAYLKTVKMNPIDVKSDSFAEYNEESNEKDPKFKVGGHVRISKYKNIFAKGYAPYWSEETFVAKKITNTVTWTYVISDLNGEEIIGSLYEKELLKTNQKEFRIEKILKTK